MKHYDVKTIKIVCEKYAYERFSTLQTIAEDEELIEKKLSPSKISKYLHLGITRNIIDDITAEMIKQKAINNSTRYTGSGQKITDTYRRLFKEREQFKKFGDKLPPITKVEPTSNETIQQLYKEFFISTFSSVFSDSDEFPVSGDNIEELEKYLCI